MASNVEDTEPRDDEEKEEEKSAGNWLGRWVLIIAIFAFLAVYMGQLWQGAGLMFAILISTAAMGVVGAGGLALRQMLLRTASQDRAANILSQMREHTEGAGNVYADGEEE